MTNNTVVNSDGNILIASLIAGLGGMLPTLCRLASANAANPETFILSPGYLSAIGLYFVIGSIVCVGFQETRRREAFTLGIAAPAIISSVLTGASGDSYVNAAKHAGVSFISSAYAETSASTNDIQEKSVLSSFWKDFKNGLGIIVAPKISDAIKSDLENCLDDADVKATLYADEKIKGITIGGHAVGASASMNACTGTLALIPIDLGLSYAACIAVAGITAGAAASGPNDENIAKEISMTYKKELDGRKEELRKECINKAFEKLK